MQMKVYKCDLKISENCKGDYPKKEYTLYMMGVGLRTHYPKARGLDVCVKCMEAWAEKYWS